MTTLEALIILNQLPKIGTITIKRLIAYFGSATEVLKASEKALLEVPQCRSYVATIVSQWPRHSDLARELRECERSSIKILTSTSEYWPIGLNDLKDPPTVLYVKGDLSLTNASSLSVIGSRKTTNYGRMVTAELTRAVATTGHTIISGLALGIDTIAHQTALQQDQYTYAILGSGLSAIYPRQNLLLAEAISEQGALISQFPLFQNPDKQSFPQRNKLVAAWSKGTLVTEMPIQSGAMITAQYARELKRPVYAIPGPIDRPSSAGCHKLIQEGAKLVFNAEDILQDLDSNSNSQLSLDFTRNVRSSRNFHNTLTLEESSLLSKLSSLEQSLELLHDTTKIPMVELTTTLFELEMKNLVTQHAGMTYTKK